MALACSTGADTQYTDNTSGIDKIRHNWQGSGGENGVYSAVTRNNAVIVMVLIQIVTLNVNLSRRN